MKILFSTGTLYQLPLLDTFSLVREAGFDGCDLVVNKTLDDPRYRELLQEALAVLPAHSLHVPLHRLRFWGGPVEAIPRCVQAARELGIRVVNFHPPSWYYHEIGFYRWFRKIRDFQEELGCQDIFLAIENMPRIGKRLKLAPYVLNDFRDLIEFGMKRNLYFTFDTTHVGTFDHDALAAFLAFHKTERLKNVHLSDFSGPSSHLFIGRGALHVARLLNTMRAVGYDEMVTLEVAPHELPITREWLLKMMRYTASFMKMHLGEDRHG